MSHTRMRVPIEKFKKSHAERVNKHLTEFEYNKSGGGEDGGRGGDICRGGTLVYLLGLQNTQQTSSILACPIWLPSSTALGFPMFHAQHTGLGWYRAFITEGLIVISFEKTTIQYLLTHLACPILLTSSNQLEFPMFH